MTTWNFTGLGDNASAYSSIAGESLHFYNDEVWQTYIRRVGPDNFRLAWSGDKLAGGLAFYRCGQWYGGNSIPTAAVSGVGIEPAFRGAGACKALLIQTLRELADEGVPMASLFASTQRLYRSVGFEQSGVRIEYSMPMASLAMGQERTRACRELQVTRELEPKLEPLTQLSDARGRITNGNLERTTGLWERIKTPIGGGKSCTYFFGNPSNPEGYITLWMRDRSSGHPAPLIASDWVAITPAALDRMIALITDHNSMCDRFEWSGGVGDPLLFRAAEQRFDVGGQLMTLNRILDVKAALETRGYPPSFEGELHLDISDPIIKKNSGKWILRVQDGCGSVEPGGNGFLRASIDALVPMFTSYRSATQLHQLGKIEVGPADNTDAPLSMADLAFSGPAPWTSEIF
ncbi:MAG: enhanced intracellular survival protein Eis [Aureliella sp.]